MSCVRTNSYSSHFFLYSIIRAKFILIILYNLK